MAFSLQRRHIKQPHSDWTRLHIYTFYTAKGTSNCGKGFIVGWMKTKCKASLKPTTN